MFLFKSLVEMILRFLTKRRGVHQRTMPFLSAISDSPRQRHNPTNWTGLGINLISICPPPFVCAAQKKEILVWDPKSESRTLIRT